MHLLFEDKTMKRLTFLTITILTSFFLASCSLFPQQKIPLNTPPIIPDNAKVATFAG
jgi:hypothetical protein